MTKKELFEAFPEIVVYDFEVFKKYWCVAIADREHPEEQDELIIDSAKDLLLYQRSHPDHVFVGYNTTHYDRWIWGGIVFGSTHEQLARISADCIQQGFTNRASLPEGFCSYDTGDISHSLKQLEGFMGDSIEESTVPFDFPGELSQAQKEEVWHYCKHDVSETVKVLIHRIADFSAQKALIETFNLDPVKAWPMTKAQLTATVLDCSDYQIVDEFGHTARVSFAGEEWHNSILPCVSLHKYTEVLDFYADPDNYRDGQKLKITVAGVEHVFGLGGIHGAIKRYHKKGNLLHVDVTSYYPSMMIEWNLLTRKSRKPELFKQVYDTRVALKKAGKKAEQAPYKIILNSTFGISNQAKSKAYDPRRNHEVCINGQLMLLMLIEMLEDAGCCNLVQSNTDGLIVDCIDRPKTEEICHAWEKITRMGLGIDEIDEIWQKDVNNYLFRFANGRFEAKGAWTKFNGPLDNDLAILNEALRAGLVAGTIEAVDACIDNCNDLSKFQKIVKLSSLYKKAYFGGNPIRGHKCFRVFAVEDGEILGKQKREGATIEKFGNTPESCTVVFGDLRDPDLRDIFGDPFSIERVDKDYYKQIARKRFMDFAG